MNDHMETQVEKAKREIARAYDLIKKGVGMYGIVCPTICDNPEAMRACRRVLDEIPVEQKEWVIFHCISCHETVYP